MKKLILSLTLLALPATSVTHAHTSHDLDDFCDALFVAPTRSALLAAAAVTGAAGAVAHFGAHRYYKKRYQKMQDSLDEAGRARLRSRMKIAAWTRNALWTLAGLSGAGYGAMAYNRIKNRANIDHENQLKIDRENEIQQLDPDIFDAIHKHAGLIPTKDGLILEENRKNFHFWKNPQEKRTHRLLTGSQAESLKKRILVAYQGCRKQRITPSPLALIPPLNMLALMVKPGLLVNQDKGELSTKYFKESAKALRKEAKKEAAQSNAKEIPNMSIEKLKEKAVAPRKFNGPAL